MRIHAYSLQSNQQPGFTIKFCFGHDCKAPNKWSSLRNNTGSWLYRVMMLFSHIDKAAWTTLYIENHLRGMSLEALEATCSCHHSIAPRVADLVTSVSRLGV